MNRFTHLLQILIIVKTNSLFCEANICLNPGILDPINVKANQLIKLLTSRTTHVCAARLVHPFLRQTVHMNVVSQQHDSHKINVTGSDSGHAKIKACLSKLLNLWFHFAGLRKDLSC